MNELVVADRASQWHNLKALVLDSVSSPITRRVYNLGLDEFIAWYGQEPRPTGFTKATVTAWRVALEESGARLTLVRYPALRMAVDPDLISALLRIHDRLAEFSRREVWARDQND
jgi:hypothetical protein